MTKNYNQPNKQKPSSDKPTTVKELQPLTVAELDAVAGAGLRTY